jgi:septum formation protein
MLVLASASPQRRAILEQLGVTFTVTPADVEELTQGDPETVALENALRKARAVTGDVVLGVDTLVAVDGEIFGKPADAGEAAAMLTRLQGRTHEVWSGIVVAAGQVHTETVRTAVTFAAADAAEIDRYVATGEWQGRAGGYAIQGRGAWLVAGIEGDYFNVVGLPVAALRRLLDKASTSG